MMNLPVGGTG